MVHIIWCWLDNHTNWNCHNLMKVPVWNTRNTNLSELCLRTVANVNKILKERKKTEIPLVFLEVGLCSYLQRPSLKLGLPAVFWASAESPAPCRECACSSFPMPRRSCSHKSDTPHWTTCMEDYFYKEDRLWCPKLLPLTEGHHVMKNKKSFHPWWRKIIMEE